MKALIALISFCISTAALAETPSAQHQLEAFASNMNSFSANFSQQIRSANGHLEEPESGQFKLLRPNLFRWDYGGEYPQQIVADGSQVWIYDLELEQVSIKPQAQSVDESPALVLLQPEKLDEFFVVTELGEDLNGSAMLSMTPRSKDAAFERIILALRDNIPQILILEDGFGQRTEISFTEQLMNPEIETDQFQFTAPDGTDVIGGELF